MKWRFWLVAGAGMAAGYGGYRWFQQVVEGRMRQEIEAPLVPRAGEERGKISPLPQAGQGAVPHPSAGMTPLGIEERILAAVREHPGILQTEIYDLLAGENRRTLQDLLLQMDRNGEIRREREGSTYRLEIVPQGRKT